MSRRRKPQSRRRRPLAEQHTPVIGGHIDVATGHTYHVAGAFTQSGLALTAGEAPSAVLHIDLTGKWNHGAPDKLSLLVSPAAADEWGRALIEGAAAARADLKAYLAGYRPDDHTRLRLTDTPDQVDAVTVRVLFHDPLSMGYRTLVIGADHWSSGAEHDGCDALALVSPELDSAYCSKCRWQARISGAWYVDITQAVWRGPEFAQHDRTWRIPADDGDYGVLVEMQHEKSRHWFVLCPGSSTLYLYESDGSIDLTDCHDGDGCNYLDDVHANAHVLVRYLDLLR